MTETSLDKQLTQCPHCASALDPLWSFCPQCGAASSAAHAVVTVPRKREKYPIRNAFGGLLFGFLSAPVCLIVGGMLCCTGLGAFAGVPLIILGIFAPLIGSILGLNELNGKCPWCGTRIISIVNHSQDFACPACSQMIAIRDHELQKAA